LEANRARRARADSEVEAARRELVELLRLGRKLGYSVTALAAAAGLSRQTAHRHLGR
jgi:DNA-binding IclR family transcriptional regulator